MSSRDKHMALTIIEPPAAHQPDQVGLVWLTLGFRPFYLLAAVFVSFAVPLWLLQRDHTLVFHGYLSGALWHQHEMLFGFVAAVIVGFLFTAGKVWTGLPTPTGKSLLGFAMLWLMARLLLPIAPAWLAVPLDLSFLPAAGWVLTRMVWRSHNLKNLPIVGALLVLAICNLIFHLALLGVLPFDPSAPMHVALGAVVMLVQAMAARVIPGFTANAIPHAKIKRYRWLGISTHLMLGLAMISVVTAINTPISALLTAIAAMLLLSNLWCWDMVSTLHKPILWILHLSYAWIPLGLLLLAAAALGWIPVSIAWHALTVGAMSGMIAGMITRTALGHTGRPLNAGRVELAMYLLINLAACARIIPGIFWPQVYEQSLLVSAGLWTTAFLVYSVAYFPILTQKRADGRPG